ncbi:MAG: sugar phosphate isomerase/epimerase [Duncaniella sp.]|nr:sugar phosphate isomerase/epimerase [Duncaniella sp.]
MNIKRLFIVMFVALLTLPVVAQERGRDHRYKVAACDWMMLKRQKLGEFKLTKELKGDGVEMDVGGLGARDTFDNKLHQPHFRMLFRNTADSLGVAVPSVAMSGFFGQSFIGKPTYATLIDDCLSTMEAMGSKVAFLPLGGIQEDWTVQGSARAELVRRLRESGAKAAAKGMVIGVRVPLPAKEAKKFIKEINSPGVKIYYNLQDALDAGRDPVKELKTLGKDNICQIHLSNTDGFNLKDDPAVDLPAIKAALDKMGWSGWLVVERSRDKDHVRDVKRNFGNNIAYIKEVFQND